MVDSVEHGDTSGGPRPPRAASAPGFPAAPAPDRPAPDRAAPAHVAWSRPGEPSVAPDAATTELPRGAFPAPGAAPNDDAAFAGTLPSGSPFGSADAPAQGSVSAGSTDAAPAWRSPAPAGDPWTPAAFPSHRPVDAASPWWNQSASGGLPPGPPEYDPSRFGGLGAAGGVPQLAAPPGGHPAEAPRRSTSMRAAMAIGVVSAVIASLITGGLFVTFVGPDGSDAGGRADRGPAPTLVAPLDIYELLEKAQPSVVSIRTDLSSPSGTTPFGAGSGVIISDDGLVLTNAHVINGSSAMRVTLYDGHELDATLVGSFPNDDIALIRIADTDPLVPAVLGSSADIVVGDPVVAIGNALNLGGPPSVTEGIVSAKDRNIQTREGTLRNLIQTDAAINPGNSGGPLLNAQGQVVGINTAIIDDAQNIGFAIAIDLLKPLIDDLKAGRGDITPESPFLGVSTQSVSDVTAAALERYGVTAEDGAFISEVVPGSGAEAAGLQPGDVIVGIDGQPVTSSTDVGELIRNREAGEMITIDIERKGERRALTATLKSRSETGN